MVVVGVVVEVVVVGVVVEAESQETNISLQHYSDIDYFSKLRTTENDNQTNVDP